MLEELAAIMRLLSVDEIVEIVQREMEARAKETKGADRPRSLKWYMRFIKDSFYERDRQMEESERRRDEKKQARARASPGEPVSFASVVEELADQEMTDEERERVVERIRAVREKISAKES